MSRLVSKSPWSSSRNARFLRPRWVIEYTERFSTFHCWGIHTSSNCKRVSISLSIAYCPTLWSRADSAFQSPSSSSRYDVISSPSDIVMVIEYLSGELFDYIVKRGKMPEDEARRFFQQIMSALDYCHSHNIVHRDLKPEKWVLTRSLQSVVYADWLRVGRIAYYWTRIWTSRLRISDCRISWGMEISWRLVVVPRITLHQKLSLESEFFHLLGTFLRGRIADVSLSLFRRLYAGPEIDIWSCGVILFVMLCGRLPFDDDHIPLLFKKINGKLPFRSARQQ